MSTDWNPALYDGKLGFVTAYGQDLVELLDPRPGERILDLGCGTGHLTRAIADRGAHVIGLDASSSMIAQARASYPDLEFVVGDGSDFDYEGELDAVFSNAALHWILPPEGAAASIARSLRPGGRLVAEFGGRHNVRRLLGGLFAALGEHGCPDASHCWFFPAVGEYAALLESFPMEVRSASLFDRWTALEGEDGLSAWFEVFREGIRADVDDASYARAVARAEDILRPSLYHDGTWHADYRRLRVYAVRTEA